jgi:Acetyltransferases, including N-acetylases of ribosomal proteins
MKYLRDWSLGDAADIATALNNKKILDNLRDGIPFPYTASDAAQYIKTTLDAPKGTVYAWAVVAGGKAVGSLGIFRRDNIHCRTAELGYYIAEPRWNQGIMTGAVKEACGYIFENTDIVRIFAEPFAANAASCRVLEKAGFSYEGTLHKNAVKNGEIIDMKLYALTK